MQDKHELGPLTFGFDIGIASVGWAVLNPVRIVALGVRAFDAAEEPKTGAPLNEHRRLMKTQRNRLHRRVHRLKKLRRLLRDSGTVPSADIEHFNATARSPGSEARSDPWVLRARGLDELLSPGDWARVLYHIVKHRGFFAARKSETVDADKEGGKLSKGVKRTTELMQGRWRTIGEMAAKDEAFARAKRNKAGDYSNSFSRKSLDEELRSLFERQRMFGNPAADGVTEAAVRELMWFQKPAVTGKAMLEMIGKCTFEQDEYRAPKNSFSAERFVWLSLLNRIRVDQGGQRRPLSPAERAAAMPLPYELQKVSYKQLRDRLVKMCGFPKSWREASFSELSYRPVAKRDKQRNITGITEPDDVEAKDGNLIKLAGWHKLKKELDTDLTRAAWERVSGAALSGDPSMIDTIALALSIYKSDDELRPELAKLALNEMEVDAILKVDYAQFIQLSTKAIGKLMPHLEVGLRYDEACEAAGYNHAQPNAEGTGLKYLPPFSPKELRNPVVFRALNQARKVLNALVREYGSPSAVHVELARDLSKSFEERKDIERGQKEFQAERQATFDYFIEQIGRAPKADELLKMRLYREQDGQCAYSLKPLAPDGDIRRIFERRQTEIDHVLPYSRSFDDSQNNKVLVLTEENQNKGNHTPFEYLGGANENERWREFEAWVRGHKIFRKAKRDRLLRQNFGAEEAEGFKERNLNDTRYITRFFSGYVRQHLAFAADETGEIKKPENRVLCPAGGFTSFLRTRWGLVKNRAQSDLHHALDACVVAAASRTLQKRVSDFSRIREEYMEARDGKLIHRNTGEIVDSSHFPQPWAGFRDEVEARLSPDARTYLVKNQLRREYDFANYTSDERALVRPILVSRALRRLAGGAVHLDTVRSTKEHLGPHASSSRIQLKDIQFFPAKTRKRDESDPDKVQKKLDEFISSIVGVTYSRNNDTINAIRTRLLDAKGDGAKAFPADKPLHKPSRSDKLGPIIRAVKLLNVQKGGVPVRGGVADQASMWRVDVFKRNGNWFFVPIYQSDRRKNAALPNKAVFQGKELEDWPVMLDEEFVYSLFANDYIEVRQKKRTIRGYFQSLHSRTGNLNIAEHDKNKNVVKDGVHEGVGPKTAELIIKFNVDVLGNIYPAKPETRRGLA